jgi:hypothetical protein
MYSKQLRDWFEKEKSEHGLIDMKFFPGTDREQLLDDVAREVLEVVTGKREVDEWTEVPF